METFHGNTLTQLLKARSQDPAKGIVFIEKNGNEEFLSYADLWNEAHSVLYLLQQKGVHAGAELVIQLEDNKTFVIVFWACMLGGIIAVPLSVGKTELNQQKLFNVWDMLIDPCLFTSPELLERNEKTITGALNANIITAMRHSVIFDHEITHDQQKGVLFAAEETDIAFLQFSSGSTGNSKGIILTHANLLSNLDGIHRTAGYTPNDTSLSWMPLTHDMGLIGFHLNPLYSNMKQYLLPTSLFIIRPSIWLDKCAAHKITITCSPNFGYSYVLRHSGKVNDRLDLSALRIIYNGAEPISFDLCQVFTETFAKNKLKESAMCPVYGLAEATLAVSISDPGRAAESVLISRQLTGIGAEIVPPQDASDALTVVNVGVCIHDMKVRIADLHHRDLGEGKAGVIQISGPSVTAGYYNNPAATRAVKSEDGWLSTGDTGFIQNGSLFILGRIKDVLFVNGQNYYAHDLEKIAQEVNGIELNKIAIAGVFDHQQQRDEIIAFILYRNTIASFATLAIAVNDCVLRKTGFSIDTIIPVKDIPKTTSGKLQRYQLAEQYANGDFNEVKAELARYKAQEYREQFTNLTATPDDRFLQLCRVVLQHESIQLTDRFIDWGGNSLRAAALSMAVLKGFEATLTIEEIYSAGTLAEIAEMIEQKKGSSRYYPLEKAPEAAEYELSALQTGIYQYCRMNPLSLTYNVPVFFRLFPGIDCIKLEKVMQGLIRRHDILRIGFSSGQSGFMQIQKEASFRLGVFYTTETDTEAFLKQHIQPFDLTKAPLMRAGVVHQGDGTAYFFLDVHHIIADGISVTMLLNELLQLYNEQKPSASLVSYADYCVWEKKQHLAENFTDAGVFWHQYLEGELPLLDVPCDYQRPAVFSGKGKRFYADLPVELTATINRYANQHKLTLHSFFFTVYSLFLQKISGQDEMIIGIPVSSRMHPDLEHAIGMFVNSLPVKVKLTDTNDFLTAWEQQASNLQQVFEHQQYPFSKLRTDLNLRRDVSRNPVFDTMFVYQNMPLDFLRNNSVFSVRIPADAGISKYDLSLEVIEENDRFSLSLEYATDLFSEKTMQLWLRYYVELLRNVTVAPDSALHLQSMELPEQQLHRVSCISAETLLRKQTTISHLLEVACTNYATRTAIQYKGLNITYAAFSDMIHTAAAKLQRLGIGTGDVVALCGERSPALIVVMMAVLQTGACFLPLDTNLPAERADYMLHNSRCKLLVKDTRDNLADGKDFIVSTFQELTDGRMERAVPVLCRPGDLCYILYTSGTTGLPKGVMIEHHSLVNYVQWGSSIYCKGRDAHFPLFTSISFDLTLTSIFIPLLTGNSIVIYDDAAEDFLLKQVLEDNKVSIIKATPSHLRLLLNNYLPQPGLRVSALIVGGEQFGSSLANELHGLFDGKVTIYNEYGPTEATIGCMTYTFDPADTYQHVPIGVAADHTHIYVLDKRLNPVPVGVNGEIYIAGAGLARGYYDNDTLTNERFIENPFCKGERMYRTGDIGRLLEDNLITYCGRVDEQVKINGYRIELNEIQLLVRSNPHIRDAVAVVRKGRAGQSFICIFYTSTPSADAIVLRAALKDEAVRRLPYYMVPSFFIQIDEIPLTRNQKTDIRYLETCDLETEYEDTSVSLSAVEQSLLQIWRDILHEPGLRATDNFFEFGGDSISAIQIVSAAREAGIMIAVKDILTAHTVQHLACYAQREQYDTSATQQEDGYKQLSPVEKWFFAQKLAYPGAYNQAVLLECTAKLNRPVLKDALSGLAAHHDALRMNYDAGKKMLFFNPDPPAPRMILFNQEISEQEPSFEKIKEASGLSDHIFDITRDLLFSASIVKTGSGKEFIFLVAHHLVTDGVSWHILLQDLERLYKGLQAVPPVRNLLRASISLKKWLEHATVQYRQLANDSITQLYTRVESFEYTIPADYSDIDWRMLHARTIRIQLPRVDTDFLRKQGSVLFHADMEMILFLAIAQSLQVWTGITTCKIEAESHGREWEGIDLSATAGWFTAIYTVLISLKSDDILNQLKSVKEQVKQGRLISQHYGFIKYSDIDAHELYIARPEIRLNYLGEFGGQHVDRSFRFVDSGMRVQSAPENYMSAKLEVNAMIHHGELIAEFMYNETIHHHETAYRFVQSVKENLEKLAAALSHEKQIHFTPSDFSGVQLNEEEIDTLFN